MVLSNHKLFFESQCPSPHPAPKAGAQRSCLRVLSSSMTSATFFWVAMTSCVYDISIRCHHRYHNPGVDSPVSERAAGFEPATPCPPDRCANTTKLFFESQCPPMNYGLEGRCLLASRRGFEPQWLEWAQWAEFFTLLRPINKLSKHVMFFINQQCSELSPPCPLSPSSSTM